MTQAAAPVQVRREPVERAVRRQQRYIHRFERLYGMSSAEMEFGLKSGTLHETVGISRWLGALDFLRALGGHGATTGSLTTSTR